MRSGALDQAPELPASLPSMESTNSEPGRGETDAYGGPRPGKPSVEAGTPVAKTSDRRTAQRIGVYDVKKTLGEGSFGKVKLATHRVSGQQVALKIISRKKLT